MSVATLEAKLRTPWSPDELDQLDRTHTEFPFAFKLAQPSRAAEADGLNRHADLTALARKNDEKVRRLFGLSGVGDLHVEHRATFPRQVWRDGRGQIRTGYGLVCCTREVYLGGTVREATKALATGVVA